jgi:serine protease
MRGPAFVASVLGAAGCAVGGSADELSSTANVSFEEFRALTYHEDFEGGVYIVDGDTPVIDDKALYEFWESQQQGALIVNRVGQSDDRWSDAQKTNLTYCISNNFNSWKPSVVDAMKRATETIGWETMANVNFTYVPAQDANCTTSNPNVVFAVKMVSGQPYLARAFFPSTPKSARDVLVDTSSFGDTGWSLASVLGHELGHVLGFRHEHTRPEAGTCFEDTKWRPLTPYDNKSIMHYPQCNGGTNALAWSAQDKVGATALYGAPGGGTTTPPPPSGTTKTDTKTGSVAQGASANVGTYAAVGGTTLSVKLTGTGDPDLYVRFGSAPTATQFNCRPYLDGPNEECTLTVPAGGATAYVMVYGYAAATYSITTSWIAP